MNKVNDLKCIVFNCIETEFLWWPGWMLAPESFITAGAVHW